MPSACQKKPRTCVSAVRLLMSQTQMSLKSSHRTGPGAQLHQGNGLVCTIRPRGRLGLLPPISAEGLILGKARQRAGARRAWLHLSQDMAKGISMGCLEHSLKPQSLLCGTGLGFRRRRRPMKVCTPCALPIPSCNADENLLSRRSERRLPSRAFCINMSPGLEKSDVRMRWPRESGALEPWLWLPAISLC